MSDEFAARLDVYVKQAALPVRRIAHQAGVPDQTLGNWLRGAQTALAPSVDRRPAPPGLGARIGGSGDRSIVTSGGLPVATRGDLSYEGEQHERHTTNAQGMVHLRQPSVGI